MKNLILMLLCCIFMFSSTYAQSGEITYSPGIYKELKTHFYSSVVQKNITAKHNNQDQQRIIETEYLRFMALSPQSKLKKIGAMGQCLVNEKLITQSELKLITGLFAAFKSGNQKAAMAASKKLRNTTAKSSPVIKAVAVALQDSDSNAAPNPHASTETNTTEGDRNIDHAKDLIIAGSTLAGATIGYVVGGGTATGAKYGAAAGAASGEVSGGMLKKFYDWLWGKGNNNVIAGPNGEDCQPPFITFW